MTECDPARDGSPCLLGSEYSSRNENWSDCLLFNFHGNSCDMSHGESHVISSSDDACMDESLGDESLLDESWRDEAWINGSLEGILFANVLNVGDCDIPSTSIENEAHGDINVEKQVSCMVFDDDDVYIMDSITDMVEGSCIYEAIMHVPIELDEFSDSFYMEGDVSDSDTSMGASSCEESRVMEHHVSKNEVTNSCGLCQFACIPQLQACLISLVRLGIRNGILKTLVKHHFNRPSLER